MEETLKAKIRNLLSPSYNLASIINQDLNLDDPDIKRIVISEANKSTKNIEEILKLLDNEQQL